MCVPLQRFRQARALSSAGSEHLPYKQRVGGSNPSAPTLQTLLALKQPNIITSRALSSAGSEHLPYKQRVGGSNPSAPTPSKPHRHHVGVAYFFALTWTMATPHPIHKPLYSNYLTISRKLCSIRSPHVVMMLSGWNCKPYTGRVLCLIDIMFPSSSRELMMSGTSSPMLNSSITHEW